MKQISDLVGVLEVGDFLVDYRDRVVFGKVRIDRITKTQAIAELDGPSGKYEKRFRIEVRKSGGSNSGVPWSAEPYPRPEYGRSIWTLLTPEREKEIAEKIRFQKKAASVETFFEKARVRSWPEELLDKAIEALGIKADGTSDLVPR